MEKRIWAVSVPQKGIRTKEVRTVSSGPESGIDARISYPNQDTPMLDKKFLDDLNEKITQLLPRAGELGEDARTALRQLLQKAFDELNIMSQEEFDSRVRALDRAEQRIAELERELAVLEKKVDQLSSPTDQ